DGRYLNCRSLGSHRLRRGSTDAPMIPVLVLIVVIDGELVLVADLPRDPPGTADDVAVVNAGFAEIRLVCDGLWTQRVGVDVGHGFVHATMTKGSVEPELVFHDGTAETRIEVPDFLDDAHIGEGVRGIVGEIASEIASEILTLPRSVSEVAEYRTVE